MYKKSFEDMLYGYWICPECEAEHREKIAFPDDSDPFVDASFVETVTCKECGKTFPTYYEATSHEENREPGSVSVLPANRVTCPKCGNTQIEVLIIGQVTPEGKTVYPDQKRAEDAKKKFEKIVDSVDIEPPPDVSFKVMSLPKKITCKGCGYVHEYPS